MKRNCQDISKEVRDKYKRKRVTWVGGKRIWRQHRAGTRKLCGLWSQQSRDLIPETSVAVTPGEL
jgi:hypothetical protein